MEALENIDDDCDRNGIILVKLDNPLEAKEYGIDAIPTLVYFEVRNPQFALCSRNFQNVTLRLDFVKI